MQQSRRIQPWMLVSAAWLAPAFLGFVTAVGEAHIFGEPLELAGAIFYSADWLLYAVLTPGVFFFARRWPIARPHLVSRTLIHVALSLVFSALWAGGGTLLKLVLQPIPSGTASHSLPSAGSSARCRSAARFIWGWSASSTRSGISQKPARARSR